MLSETVKAKRKSRNLTQAQLAKSAEVDQSFISRIERGEVTNVGLDTLRRIETALGVRPGTLVKTSAA